MESCLHIVPSTDESNGVWRMATLLSEHNGGRVQTGVRGITAVDEVWVHGMWLPKEWLACGVALLKGKRLVRMTHGSLSPIYLKCQSPLKKKLVSPIERYLLRRADKVVATCEAEAEWIRAYEPKIKEVEVIDARRFFNLEQRSAQDARKADDPLHILYLGRRHPLKGIDFLVEALSRLNGLLRYEFRVVSNAFGEEKEKVWDWCNVLVQPTLSENFGLVVAEALERGKRVITTDGAPAWGDGNTYGGRLIYLKGFRDGTREMRVRLLKDAIEKMYKEALQ